jgi:hypothetical protein
MSITKRLLIAVAALSAVAVPVAHAQFGGFGNGFGSSGLGSGLTGFGGQSGATSTSPGQAGQSGASTDSGSSGDPGVDAPNATDTSTTPTTTPAATPAPATTDEWACPDGTVPSLDENGNWIKDDAGVPQCVDASPSSDSWWSDDTSA